MPPREEGLSPTTTKENIGGPRSGSTGTLEAGGFGVLSTLCSKCEGTDSLETMTAPSEFILHLTFPLLPLDILTHQVTQVRPSRKGSKTLPVLNLY